MFATFVLSIHIAKLQTMNYDVFISYSRKDREIAEKVCAVLNRFKKYYTFEYFIDRSEIKARDEYLKRISKAISQSKTVLFIASQNAYKSDFCAKELLFADKRGIHIIQYRIDESEPPMDLDMLLGTHQYRESKTTTIEDVVREVLSDSLSSDIQSIAEIEAKNDLENKQKQALYEQELRDSINALENRKIEIKTEILSCQQKLLVLEREKEGIEQQVATLRSKLGGESVGGDKSGNKPEVSNDDDSSVVEPTPLSIKKIWLPIMGWAKKLIIFAAILLASFIALGGILKACKTEPSTQDRTTTSYYSVGDYYDDGTKQGVVFQVWDDGRHGKIVSLDQAELKWCTTTQYDKGIVIRASSKSDGWANTNAVMSRLDSAEYPAFAWCRAKGNEWYLPAIDELRILLLDDSVHNAVNRTLKQQDATKLFAEGENEWYWSSTEENEFCAWGVIMYDGYTSFSLKKYNVYVRAVSAF